MNLLFLLLSLEIVASTTDISSVVEAVAPEEARVYSLVPGGMCPGHFDLSPVEANKLFQSDLIVYHGFESWLKKVKELKLEVRIVDLQTDGNWMIPDVYLKGAGEVAGVLKEEYGSDSVSINIIDSNYKKLEVKIDSLSGIIKRKKEPIKDVRVICSEHQKDFLEFLGAEVVSVFSPGDDISLKETAEVIKAGRDENVRLVVDNLQSGQKVGRTIADEIKIKYVVLSNFPGENGYKATLLNNVNILLDILSDRHTRN